MRGKFDDISGKKFGRLTAIRRCELPYNGVKVRYVYPTKWLCVCECGSETLATHTSLKNGDKKSCGCLKVEREHGLCDHYLYSTWSGIKTRCNNPNSISFKDYGAKGVTMYKPWADSFILFYTDILAEIGERPSALYSLDRPNTLTDNYEPGVLRWATDLEQTNNATSNIVLEFQGKTQTLSQWCSELNMKYQTVYDRLQKLKWDTDRALMTPAPPFDGTNPVNRESCHDKQAA